MNTMMQNAKEENLEYIQKRVDEVIKKHCDANDEGDIKIYTDYESSYLSDRGLSAISGSDNPREHFREMLAKQTVPIVNASMQSNRNLIMKNFPCIMHGRMR